MWPPSSVDSAFAWSTIAIAFQRTSAVASRSSSGSPGIGSSSSTGIVLTYGVLSPAETLTPYSCAWSIAWSSKNAIRSRPSNSTTASTESSHSWVSTGSGSVSGTSAATLLSRLAAPATVASRPPDPVGAALQLPSGAMSTGEHPNGSAAPDETAAQLRAATELLESVARDRGLLGSLSVEERARLLSAAADVFDPDVVQRRRFTKSKRKQEKAARVGDRRDAARRDRHPRPARKAGVHDAERLPAEGLRAGRPRRRAPRDDRGTALLRLQAAVPGRSIPSTTSSAPPAPSSTTRNGRRPPTSRAGWRC